MEKFPMWIGRVRMMVVVLIIRCACVYVCVDGAMSFRYTNFDGTIKPVFDRS